jgi:CRP-like cAMP-binding protein
MQQLITKLNNISPLSAESNEKLTQILVSKMVDKNEFLLRKGNISDCFHYLKKGTVRIFYHKKDREITEWIALNDEFFLSIASFYEQKPSILSIQALERSEIIYFPRQAFLELCAQYHDIETLHRSMITQSLLLSQVRMESIQFETAQERYERLITERPEIIQRVSLTYIASFLGITLETLSRIRRH